MITPKIILLKLLPSLIIATAILLGLYVLAKKVETTIDAYLKQVQVSQSDRNSEIDSRISDFMTVADAIARRSRFQYAIYENKDDAYSSSPTHYLFDSLNGEVIKEDVYGIWSLPRKQTKLFSSDKSPWVEYVERTEMYEAWRKLRESMR